MKTKVPQEQWAKTPIYLKATAGMRLLEEADRTAILSSVQRFLGDTRKNPFAFHPADAKVISGIEEGAVSGCCCVDMLDCMTVCTVCGAVLSCAVLPHLPQI